MNEAEVRTTSSADNAPDVIRALAKKITDSQGCAGQLSREESGYHLSIPCPDCLFTHKQREADDPKYSINLSKVAGLGENFEHVKSSFLNPTSIVQAMDQKRKINYGSSICMRTLSSRNPHRYSMEEILNMSTVMERHPDLRTASCVTGQVGSEDRESYWEIDPVSGKLAPPPPGDVVKLSDLPVDHPAVAYLKQRNYNIADLESQFRCGFCTREFPHGEKSIYYRTMPGGWRDTPQHRIIFYSMVDGAPMTWQARVIERVTDYIKFQLHPYAGGYYPTRDEDKIRRDIVHDGFGGVVELIPDGEGTWGYLWSRTHVRSNSRGSWMPIPPFDEINATGSAKFKPSKYRTAKYSTRQIMGWDAAVEKTAKSGELHPSAILCEGPLDAARTGPGGLAILGSNISSENAARIASTFTVVYSAFDSDKAGRAATKKITHTLMNAQHRYVLLQAVIPLQIPSGKDLGDMTPDQFQRVLSIAKKDFLRNS